jgi:hypothetical protein
MYPALFRSRNHSPTCTLRAPAPRERPSGDAEPGHSQALDYASLASHSVDKPSTCEWHFGKTETFSSGQKTTASNRGRELNAGSPPLDAISALGAPQGTGPFKIDPAYMSRQHLKHRGALHPGRFKQETHVSASAAAHSDPGAGVSIAGATAGEQLVKSETKCQPASYTGIKLVRTPSSVMKTYDF